MISDDPEDIDADITSAEWLTTYKSIILLSLNIFYYFKWVKFPHKNQKSAKNPQLPPQLNLTPYL